MVTTIYEYAQTKMFFSDFGDSIEFVCFFCFVCSLLLFCISLEVHILNVMSFEVILEVVDFEWPSLALKKKKKERKPLKNNNNSLYGCWLLETIKIFDGCLWHETFSSIYFH